MRLSIYSSNHNNDTEGNLQIVRDFKKNPKLLFILEITNAV